MFNRRNNIVMVNRLTTPKKDTRPDGKTFMAKYRRRRKNDLPANITIRRRYKK